MAHVTESGVRGEYRAETGNRSSVDVYKLITETVPEFFFVYHLEEKKIMFVSPQFYELADGHEGSDHNERLRSYIHPESQQEFDRFFDDLSSENDYAGRVELQTGEDMGSIKWVELFTFPVDDEKNKVRQVVGHIIDITDKKEKMSVLKEEHEKLDSVLKILAHDLRAPFSQVYMIADILMRMMSDEEKDRYGSYIGMLQNLGNRSLVLLDNLLRLVSLQEGTLTLDLKKHDLRKLVDGVMENFRINFNEKSIVSTIKAPDFAVVAEVDKILLEQAISNLVSNALKFTPAGGEIGVHIRQEDKEVQIEVQDNGIGIPEDHIPDLFKEFSKIRRKGLKGEKSTGLGLAISQQIVQLHGGKIHVKSQVQQGTTFTVELPLH
ncbi:PAS domain-containing sensor histidine kinase [Nafulsella turpanensis]|uniref:PAS domain-containing sensor histidine kinase n=1 Tax=Nafulsella turpanensis TaxID=1265690 RepID=UPI000345E40B|nr:PAS domain-containing sensor histidine kinase [Nafulsella turpanensis]